MIFLINLMKKVKMENAQNIAVNAMKIKNALNALLIIHITKEKKRMMQIL